MNIPSQFDSALYPPLTVGLPQSQVQIIPRHYRRLQGLGQTPNTILGDTTSAAAAGLSISVGILGALQAAAMGTSMAGPIGLAVSGALALTMVLYKAFQGCGQTCIQATQYVNKAEPLLQQNLASYLSQPVHYYSLQQAYLAHFDAVWSAVVAACSQQSLGNAGVNCIGDRQAGACHYHVRPGGWAQDANGNWNYMANGPDGSGSSCWNWFVGYRDPIANDPSVVPDPVPGQGQDATSATGGTAAGTGTTAGTSGGGAGQTVSSGGAVAGLPIPLLIGAALLVLAASEL